MKSLFTQKTEKLQALLSDVSELKRELKLRKNARIVLKNYQKGIDWAPFPMVALLVVNEQCNQRCLVCDVGRRVESSYYYTRHFKGKGVMSQETFRAVVDSVKKRDSELWFLATEPLLYPHLFWAIDYAANCGVVTQLTTNGYLLPEKAEELVQRGIKRICLSIDGYCAEQHDYIRGCPGSYERVMSGLVKLVEAKRRMGRKTPAIFVNTVINQWNFDSLTRIVRSLVDYEIDGINLAHLQFLTQEAARAHNERFGQFPVSARNVSLCGREKIDPHILYGQMQAVKAEYKGLRVTQVPDLKTVEDFRRYYREPDKYIEGYRICYMPWRYPHILADGDVVVNYECFSKPLGNINRESLADIWNGEGFRSFRAFIRKQGGSTQACWRCPMISCGYKL